MSTVKTVDLTAQVEELNRMIQSGQVLEAFEKFYAEDVVMQENENEPTTGKAACRLHEEAFVNGIQEFRKGNVKNVIISDGITVVEWEFDFTHKDWGVRNYTQIAVQRWNDEGQIVSEKFYYNS
ncbi:MAG: SnoaL-like domain-containing protein [Flammeovirgaceae bacterium]